MRRRETLLEWIPRRSDEGEWERSQTARQDTTRIWQHGSMSQSGPGVALRADIQRSGYYPEIVGEALDTALSSEEVISYVVHHEATFDRDELRRHVTVLVLTANRLIVCHVDEHSGEEAIRGGSPVVALESTIISHGLPRPENIRVAREIESIVAANGATPATIAILDGEIYVGLTNDQLESIANRDDVVKASVRDLPVVLARSGTATTTVAATSIIAQRVGIEVFATGGLGGVHRQARETWDESADLTTLGNTPITIVCSGVKSILDVGATLERLETLNICLVGYRTERFPGFYLADSGHPMGWQVAEPSEIADIMAARQRLDLNSALIVANPISPEHELDPDLHDATLNEGLRLASEQHITGKDVTPFLLDHFHRATHGASLEANAALIIANAGLAARIACARALG